MSEKEGTARFSDYPFRESLYDDIVAAGYASPTPIQAGCIPPALAGKDVIGLAQTGTGKTAAFALPIIHRMAQRPEMGALVLAPTRELAQQITSMFNELGRSSGIRVATVVGGIPIKEDHAALSMWPNVLVATPGRLIDHIESRRVVLSDIETLVVDEADRMHDMGFIPQIRRILKALPTERQTLMFSATMPADVERIAQRNMRTPVQVQIGRRSAPAERAQQDLFRIREADKTPFLIRLLKESEGRVLVFVRTKRGVERLARAVSNAGRRVARLHSDRAQNERDEAMSGFREGRYMVMIATDIASRGLDVADIEHVINYDFPQSAEDYVHRIGRTARVAATGKATSFVTGADERCLADLKRLTGRKLPIRDMPFKMDRTRRPSAARRRSSRKKPKNRARDSRGGQERRAAHAS